MPRALAEGRNSRRRIDRASPVPYYYQLQELLKQEIESGRWQAGDLLPSEAELAVDLGISRTVIRKALDVLEGDGQVYRVKGKGTVVARPKFRYEAVAAASGWDAEPPSEKPALERVIDARAVPAGARLGRLLDVAVAADVYELVCVHSIGRVPVSLNQVYVRLAPDAPLGELVGAGKAPELERGGPEALTQLAVRYGVDVRRSQLTVEATYANEFEAEILGVRVSTPVFLISSLSEDGDRRPVAFSRTVVRSDYFRFSVAIDHRSPAEAAVDVFGPAAAGNRP